MNGQHQRLLAKETHVTVTSNLHNLAVRIEFPTWITLIGYHRGTTQLESSAHGKAHVFARTGHTAALACGNHHAFGHFVDAGQVGRRFYQSLHVLTHGKHAIVHSLQGQQHALHGRTLHGVRCGGHTFERKVDLLLRHRIFILHKGLIKIQPQADVLFILERNGADGHALAWNSVVQSSTLYVNEAQVSLLHYLAQETHEQFVGVSALLVDVVTRVATHKSLHAHLEGVIIFRHGFVNPRESGRGACATSTTHEKLALIFRVEVDEEIALHKVVFHAHGTRKTRFLVTRKDALNGAVLNVLAFEDSHLHGHANAIVSTQSSTFGAEPFAIYIRLNGIGLKIKIEIFMLFAHHIHMALQNDRA